MLEEIPLQHGARRLAHAEKRSGEVVPALRKGGIIHWIISGFTVHYCTASASLNPHRTTVAYIN